MIAVANNRAYRVNKAVLVAMYVVGYLTSFILDAASQRICVVDANNGRSTTIFSNRGYVSAQQDQLGRLTSFTQDANGNDILRVDARNWPTTYTVDALNRVSGKLYIDSTRVTNTWDQANQQTTSVDVTGGYTLIWDLDGRKTATQNPTGINLTQTLDALGNRLVLQDNYGSTSYSWDQQSRLLTIWNPYNERTSITWDPLDREQYRILGNGMSISHTRDTNGRETVIQNIGPTGVMLAGFTNTYSPVDNRLTVLELDGTRATFSYDPASQIVSEARGGTMAYARSYSWDPVGNRSQQWDSGVLTQGTFDAANQQTLITPASGAPTTRTHDAVGNLILENIGGALTSSTWSPDNRLLTYTPTTGTAIQNLYSDDGLRRQKTEGSVVTNFTYDEVVPILETTPAGVLTARYTNYPGAWGGLTSQNRSDVSSYYGFDSQGSARILVSSAGIVTDAYSWKAFGEPIQTGSGTVNPYGYIALMVYYTELPDLVNAWNRWPQPSVGTWRSVDPIGFAGGDYNRRRYVGNNPASSDDPAGLWPSFGAGGNGCGSNQQDSVNICCSTIGPLLGASGLTAAALAGCMSSVGKGAGSWTRNDIQQALAILKQACGGGTNLCIWCLGPPDFRDGAPYPNARDVKLGYPPNCGSPCADGNAAGMRRPGPPRLRIGRDTTGYDPITGARDTGSIGVSVGKGCLRMGQNPACAALDSPPGMAKCDSVVAICSAEWGKMQGSSKCEALWHEIIHTGDVGHTYVPGVPDFVRALSCCICRAVYGPKDAACGEDCGNVFTPKKRAK